MSDMTEQTQQPEGVEQPAPEQPENFWGKVDSFFGITKSGSNFRTEIVAGVTTFMAMVYILMVNAGMFSGVITESADPYGAAYIATAIGAIIGTFLMAFFAKMPLAQASGMGINAFIVYTLLNGTGLTYANTMVFTLLDGVIFLILTVTGLRRQIFEAIPAGVRHAVPVGIGMFIAFIVLSKKNVKGAILWGLLGSAILYYVLLAIAYGCNVAAAQAIFGDVQLSNPFNAFAAWGADSAGAVFYEGFDFSSYLGMAGHHGGTLAVILLTSALSLCMIDMFDTIGTLYGACSKGNLLDENGTPVRMEKMMLADAIATCTGAIAGTSTVTTFVESSSGVAAGGRTGFTSLVTGICFIIAMFLSPIAQLIPRCATATALIWVGVLMMSSVIKVNWEDAADAIVAFMTFMVMLLGYSISKGIGMGIIVYIIIKICTGKIREISVPTWIIGALFAATFILTN